MTPPWIVEPIDILEYRSFSFASGFPAVTPNQLCLALPGKLLRSNG
jgi:hypothetical protein